MRYILLLLLIPLASFSQFNQKKVDSLLTAIKYEKIDSAKINKYNKLCVEYGNMDVEKLDFYNNEILKLSKESNYEMGLGFYYYHLSYLNICQNKKSAYSSAKKAIAIFSKCKNIEYLLLTQVCLSVALHIETKTDEALMNACKALSFALKQPYDRATAKLYNVLGWLNDSIGEY